MRCTCRQDIDKVIQLIDKQEYREALAELARLDLGSDGELAPTELSEAYLAEARCWFHLGDYPKSLLRLQEALTLSKDSADHLLYARQKHLLGLIYSATGRIEDAIEEYNEAYAARRRAGDYASFCSSLVSLALMHVLKGDLARAHDILTSALKSALEHNTPNEVSVCRINLCMVSWLQGDFAKFRATLESLAPSSSVEQARVAELQGKYLVCMLNSQSAREALGAALAFYQQEGMRREQAVCLEFLGLNEYFQSNYGEAKSYYNQVLTMREPRASAVAQTLRMLTDIHIAEGDFGKALETAKRAEEAVTKINERIELAALYRAYGQIHEHHGDIDQARNYFVKAIELLGELGARYELALSHFAAGQSAVFADELRFDHLRRAKTLFAEMGVPKRVAQVEKAIADFAATTGWLLCSSPRVGRIAAPRPAGGTGSARPVIITRNAAMRKIIALADRVKDTDMTVLITGETGTGKDLLAEYIHYTSNRRAMPYRAVNSAAIPENLLESELFGVRKGTYTGAARDKMGLIEAADGGTFYIDEICEAPLPIQAKLLRALESKTVRPLGDTRDLGVDVRFIAATNRDLIERVEKGLFRPDLYYRLQGITLDLPPLCARTEDIPLLVEYFLQQLGYGSLPGASDIWRLVLPRLTAHNWPGNVRELKSAMHRAAALASAGTVEDLLLRLGEQFEKAHSQTQIRDRLLAALERNGGNVSKAARELGMKEPTFRYRLKKLSNR